jgi:hypothetical protein
MASALNNPEVLARELNASPDSFIAGIRFDLRWDSAKFAELCEALQAATKRHAGSGELPRDLSQLFWYCGTSFRCGFNSGTSLWASRMSITTRLVRS